MDGVKLQFVRAEVTELAASKTLLDIVLVAYFAARPDLSDS